ncbi:MAG: hypothetical protein V1660_04490 [archaeon]
MTIFLVKKIWKNEVDDSVHSQFIRFSRGQFANKFVTNLSRNGKCKISTTFELTNNLVLFAFSLAGKMKVSGPLFTKENPAAMLKDLGIDAVIKKKAAIYQSDINAELCEDSVKKLAEKAYFLLFECEAGGISLKIKKKKLPQPAKSDSGKVNDKFCVMELDIKHWAKVKEEFAFDVEDFKKARMTHSIDVKEVIIPADEKDFEKMRLNAKKKGRIVRMIVADGKETKFERDFLV